uniref:FAD-binding domain-containing protein n=1 Tax=Kwoniella bestiolae CBS 10118 TaxID=1296100 RepID=A0A1B9G2K0_9TREE|nr:hypothetical protein I302_05059 [Kwoniella bestiolae CBS 10118]OCF25246.1 hypothetical protein I302_05059 [Kwoniella bestiolae CBS 10118]
MPDKARIAIIGAGPGGISLALALQQKGINDFVGYGIRIDIPVVDAISTHFTILTLDSLIIGAKAIHLER